MIFEDISHDLDSSEDVWNALYNVVYKDKFSKIFNFDERSDVETSSKCKRWYIKIDNQKQPELRKRFPKFKIAGDCDFNFNDKKVELYRKLLLKEDMPLLKKCHEFHYQLCNFSFMPITGGMNNTKGCLRCFVGDTRENIALDRFDLFIRELDKYYKGEESWILSRYNKDALSWYLSNFKDVYQYCADVYFIEDRELVDRFILSAEMPIVNRENAVKYMELALEYWGMRMEKFREFGIL